MFKQLVLSSCVVLLAACGGSGGSDNNPSEPGSGIQPPPQPGIEYPELIIGKISELTADSLNVNSYTLNISEAAINYAGEAVAPEQLKNGLIIKVQTNGAKVTQVQLDPNYAGAVTAVSADQITLGGVTLSMPNAQAHVTRGDYLLINSTANRVDVWTTLVQPLQWLEVEGVATQLNTAKKRFVLADMVVDYSQARIEDGPLNNTAWVEVFGRINNGILEATEVEVESYQHGGKTEIEGIISWVSNELNTFELNNRLTFSVTQGTRFEDGSRADLAVGRTVEVTFIAGQQHTQLLEVEYEDKQYQPPVTPEMRFSLSGQATVVNSALTVQGFNFVLDAHTRFDDGLTLQTLHGSMVEVEGTLRDGHFVVREIERMDFDHNIELEGWVDNNSIWGYQAADDSLRAYEGLWIDLECRFDGNFISACRPD